MLLPDANEWTILITGSDIDSAAIEKAQRGYFRQWSFRMLPGEILARYFQPAGDGWILHDHIRRMVKFYVINLVTDPFSNAAPHLNNMDLILCRNVFIYFDPAAVLAVAKKLAATLNDRGYMLTAHTELIGSPVIELESVLMAQGMVYQRSDRKKTHAFAPALPAVTIVEIPHIQALQHLGDSRIIAAPTTSFAADNIDKNLPDQAIVKGESLIAKARTQAHLGDFVQAENICHHALSIDPLAADVYFLLAQLAEAIDDFSLSMNYLHKTIYLNPGFVEAYLELAKLSERAGDFARAQALRNAALRIVRDLPHDKIFEHYETSAGELAQWLIKTEHQLDPTQLV
jgi:chemotaxis protein methyltransferase CheR